MRVVCVKSLFFAVVVSKHECVFFLWCLFSSKSIKSSSWTTLDKFDLIRVFDEYNVCVCKRRAIKELLVFSTLVVSQTTRVMKTHLAHIALVRFLVRVNTHVVFQSTRLTKTLLAHITFKRFLVRVNTHMYGQCRWIWKHLLAHIALVLRSFPLHSFLFKSRFFFLYLMMICLEIIIILVRYPQTQHREGVLFSLFFSLQNRPRVHRSFRMWILSSRDCLLLLLLFVVVVVVLKRGKSYNNTRVVWSHAADQKFWRFRKEERIESPDRSSFSRWISLKNTNRQPLKKHLKKEQKFSKTFVYFCHAQLL